MSPAQLKPPHTTRSCIFIHIAATESGKHNSPADLFTVSYLNHPTDFAFKFKNVMFMWYGMSKVNSGLYSLLLISVT